jgi:hypothetical protein
MCGGQRADPRFVTPPVETPSRFLRVSGRIDPRLGVELLDEFQSSEESCRVTIDGFAGAYADQIYRSSVALRRSGEGFEADVPLDLVAPGECRWRVWGVSYVVTKDGRVHDVPIPPTPLVWFQADGSDALEPIRVECGRGERFLAGVQGTQCWATGGGRHFLTPEATALHVDFVALP